MKQMKNRVIMVYASVIILLTSIALIAISYRLNWSIAINLGYGVFGSAFVSFLIYFFEYFVEKKKNFELFYTKCIDVLNALSNIKYLDYNEQADALIMYWLFKDQMANSLTLNSFYKEMLEKVRIINPNFNLSQSEFDKLSFNYVELFKDYASTYIDFMKCDFMELGLIISDSKHLVPFASKKHIKFTRDVYDFIMLLCKEVNDRAGVINSFVKGEPSKISYKLLKKNYVALNDIFFSKVKTDENNVIYAKACDELFDKLEMLKSCFYHKKYIQKVHSPKYESLL